MISESEARKSRSHSRLSEEGIPFIEHLPGIEDSTEAVLQPHTQIVQRALCFLAVYLAVNRRDRSAALECVERHRLSGKLSKRESIILQHQDLSEAEWNGLSWECEALVPLLWALGEVDNLPPATDYVSVQLVESWSSALDARSNASTLKSLDELLDQRDLHFRYHWAVRQAWLKKTDMPAGLIAGVVAERHRAFNWLTSDEWDDWDEVTADT